MAYRRGDVGMWGHAGRHAWPLHGIYQQAEVQDLRSLHIGLARLMGAGVRGARTGRSAPCTCKSPRSTVKSPRL